MPFETRNRPTDHPTQLTSTAQKTILHGDIKDQALLLLLLDGERCDVIVISLGGDLFIVGCLLIFSGLQKMKPVTECGRYFWRVQSQETQIG